MTAKGDDHEASDAPAKGDAITAVSRFTATLHDPKASQADKRLALRFIVHIIGDLHQPLHASTGDDRGGNTVSVTWFSKQTNLHSVWDTRLIEQKSLSYSEYAAWLTRPITPQNIVAWSGHDPAVWIHERITLRKTIGLAQTSLSWDHAYQHRSEVDDRLQPVGIRIAGYLNRVFDSATSARGAAKR